MVRDAALECCDKEADGQAILFLHGAVTDLRMWDEHRACIGKRYRTIAYTQRYHGAGAWQANWPSYGVGTHSQDLTAFIEQLNVGPVHLVAWSYAGHVALDATLRRPELVRSLFVYEPGVPSFVSDPAALEALAADANAAFGPVFEAVRSGDTLRALALLLAASGQSADYFERQPEQAKALQIENARTLPELLLRQAPPPEITCEQLSALKVPTCIGHGAASRPLYAVVAQAAQRCLGANRHLVVPSANHMWPAEDPAGFAQAVVDFVEQHRSGAPWNAHAEER
jgi:pimeloyl-ACP methyl ester carboxylesterase